MSSLLRHNLSNASLYKLLSFLFWNWLYFMTVEHAKERGPEWCSRVLTVLHGTVAVLVGYTQCHLPLSTLNLSRRILPIQYMLMIWSWGYFAFDLLWCLVYWSESRMILIHHAAALLSITRYMHKEHTGCTFACTLVLMELTNPLLQARWFLKTMGQGNSLVYTMVEVLYLVLFLFLRGIVGTVAMYWIITESFFDMEEKIMSLALYIVSMIFIYDIAGYIRYKYKHEIARRGEAARESRSRWLTHSPPQLRQAGEVEAAVARRGEAARELRSRWLSHSPPRLRLAGEAGQQAEAAVTEISREFFYATQLTTDNERLANRLAEMAEMAEVSAQEDQPRRYCNIL